MPLPRTRRGIRRVSALIPFPRKGKMRFHNMQKNPYGGILWQAIFFSLFIWNKKEPAKIGFNFRRTQKISDFAYFYSQVLPDEQGVWFAFHKQ